MFPLSLCHKTASFGLKRTIRRGVVVVVLPVSFSFYRRKHTHRLKRENGLIPLINFASLQHQQNYHSPEPEVLKNR